MKAPGTPIGCAEVRASLHAFTADELTATEGLRVREHLALCSSCERFCGLERAFDVVLDRGLEGEAAPAPLIVRIHRALDAEDSGATASSASPLRRPWMKWALAASLVIAVVVPGSVAVRRGYIHVPLSAAGVARSAHGTLVCAQCMHHQVPIAKQRGCREPAHHAAFLAEDGAIWEFVDSEQSRPLITGSDRIGDRIELEGLFLGEIHYVRVSAYRYPEPLSEAWRGT